MDLTRRQQIAVAALATDPAAHFAPVQVQKLFFLIDENLAGALGGRLYSFTPYDYGPFDSAVYQDLERLRDLGYVQISGGFGRNRRYSLTPAGFEMGRLVLGEQSPTVRDYFTEASKWVRSLSFAQLVGSIYKAFPHMKANSIFVG